MTDRYSRQTIFPGIGEEGQKKLGKSSVTVIGCGALGSTISSGLVRAGIGKIRIIDRDFVEYVNLHRQLLFDEKDVWESIPKAIAAELHLKQINSTVEIEGIVADVNQTNIEGFITGADVVLDGLDNLETRFLLNDAALKHNIPWIYGGVIAATGMTMTVIPHKPRCFRCVSPQPGGGVQPTCDTAGVISPAPWIIGSLQVAEAIKIIVGAPQINQDLVIIDVWEGTFHRLKTSPRRDCPACAGKYEFLEGWGGVKTTSLCGQNAVQVFNPRTESFSLKDLAGRLKPLGEVSLSSYTLSFKIDGYEMVVFPDGRAIIKNTNDVTVARGLYSKYIGM
jgi:molybdopterin-synthase adenylyltransferase